MAKYIYIQGNSFPLTALYPLESLTRADIVSGNNKVRLRFLTNNNGARAAAVIKAGFVTDTPTVSATGSGYSSIPTVAVSGCDPTTPAVLTVAISANALGAITVVNAGAGYTSTPTVTVTGGGGTGGVISLPLTTTGGVVRADTLAISNAGGYYETAPTISNVGNATITAVLTNGILTSVTVAGTNNNATTIDQTLTITAPTTNPNIKAYDEVLINCVPGKEQSFISAIPGIRQIKDLKDFVINVESILKGKF